MLDEIYEKFPTQSSMRIARREGKIKYQNAFEVGFGGGNNEREYYFDENLGQSLGEHIDSLKD